MPAKSKKQYRLMQAVCHGDSKDRPEGLSKKEACEYIEGQSPKGLPKEKNKDGGIKRKAKIRALMRILGK